MHLPTVNLDVAALESQELLKQLIRNCFFQIHVNTDLFFRRSRAMTHAEMSLLGSHAAMANPLNNKQHLINPSHALAKQSHN